MRLHSAVVRNYRVHRELAVEFDPARTLIGGANETGKSTLIEAIHHALFLRARVGGDAQKTMLSLQGAGAPEVEVAFDLGAARFTILKRFSGASGTVTLRHHGGQVWQGDAAESRLAELLGVAEVGGGRNIGDRVRNQWAHLWVWQGTSGDDPIESTEDQHQALLQRLQKAGGAVVRQSALDQRLIDHLTTQVEATFTIQGRPKAHSDLDRATRDCAEKEERHRQRRERLERLREAIDTVEQTRTELAGARERLEGLERELAEVAERRTRADALQQQEKGLEQLCFSKRQALDALQQVEGEIAAFRREAAELAERLAPRESELERLRAAHLGVSDACEAAAMAVQRTSDDARAARQRQALAEAVRARLERQRDLAELERQAATAATYQRDREEAMQALQRLPAIAQADLDGLAEIFHGQQQAEAALQAMAAGIEVVSADEPVEIDGVTLAAGESRVVTTTTEIAVGSRLRLRIRPGGGNALEEARSAVARARAALSDALGRLGVRTREEAAAVLAERATHEQRLAELEALLRGMQADQLSGRIDEARAGVNVADGEVQRRLDALHDDETLPTVLADAVAWVVTMGDRLEDAENLEKLQREIAEKRGTERAALAGEIRTADQALQADKERRAHLETLLSDRLSQFGEDDARATALDQAKVAHAEEEQRLSALRIELDTLESDMLARDHERLQRSLGETRQQILAAETRKGVAEAALQSDGSQDPAADAAVAEAEYERARAHLAATSRRAEAIRWLHTLFTEEQRQLADQYTQPLAAKITEYLQCLFGKDARAVVSWDARQSQLAGIQLLRGADGSPFNFAQLSSGTKEQLAVAVRLAVAEVLSAEHGHGLPVVLDDAFAYADPGRVARLQRMLDLAAGRGLQVIVLSCTPGDYAALGARTVQLDLPGRPQAGTVTLTTEPAESREGVQTFVVPVSPISPVPASVFEAPSSGASPAPVSSSSVGGDADRFLDALRSVGGRSGNLSLMARLCWDEARYLRAKEALIAEGRVLTGRGRGGSVHLPGVTAE